MSSLELYQKREKYHVSIRRSSRNEERERQRFQFIVNYSSDLERLKSIDCFQYIRAVKTSDNYLNVQKEVEGLFVYSMGKEAEHLFGIFDHEMIEKFVQIGEWTFESEGKYKSLKESIKHIRTKVLLILSKYLNHKPGEINHHNFFDLFSLCIKSQSKDLSSIVLSTLEKVVSQNFVIGSLLKSDLFHSILDTYKSISTQDLTCFSKQLFSHLSLLEYQSSPDIKRLTDILSHLLEESSDDSEMFELIDTLLNLFNTEIIEDEGAIVENKHILEVCCIWLLEKDGFSRDTKLCKKIFFVLETLYRHCFDSEKYIQLLASLLRLYFQPMSSKILHKSLSYKFRFFDIVSDACANCDLTETIVSQEGLMKRLLDSIPDATFNISKAVHMAITNLVLCAEMKDIACYERDILDFITDSIGEYDDVEINTASLKALIELFEHYQTQNQGKNQTNPLVDRFRGRIGVERLDVLSQTQDNKKVNSLIAKIIKQYCPFTSQQ